MNTASVERKHAKRFLVGKDRQFDEEHMLCFFLTTITGNTVAVRASIEIGNSPTSVYVDQEGERVLVLQSNQGIELYTSFTRYSDQWQYSTGIIVAREGGTLTQGSSNSNGKVVHGSEILEFLIKNPVQTEQLLPNRYPA